MVEAKIIQSWLNEISDRIRLNSSEVDRLRSEISADKRREAALRALLAADSDDKALSEHDSFEKEVADKTVVQHPVERGAIEVLKAHGRPVHVTDLREQLISRGIPIPGKGADANVIIYLARSPEICRVGRGLYALGEWGVPQVPNRRRRSKRKKKRTRLRRSS